MKKTLLFISLLHALYAQTVTLTPEQEKNWQIKTQQATPSPVFPLGEFSAQVITPPALVQTVTLPFEVHTKQFFVSQYDKVKQGQLIAQISAMAWLEAQQTTIDNFLALESTRQKNERNKMLCKDGIIPQKNCLESETLFKQLVAKYNASVALLQNYGADDNVVNDLFETLQIAPTLKITAQSDGTVASLNTSSSSSEALFVLHKNGALWLESAMEASYAKYLKEGQIVHIVFDGNAFDAKVLQRSSIVDVLTQTQTVRFEIPQTLTLSQGLRANAVISLPQPVLKVPKTAVITYENKPIVFIKNDQGYATQEVEILGEDAAFYYLKDETSLHAPLAFTFVAILKNLIGGEDE